MQFRIILKWNLCACDSSVFLSGWDTDLYIEKFGYLIGPYTHTRSVDHTSNPHANPYADGLGSTKYIHRAVIGCVSNDLCIQQTY